MVEIPRPTTATVNDKRVFMRLKTFVKLGYSACIYDHRDASINVQNCFIYD